MNIELRNKLIKEICIKQGCDMSLDYLIKRMNEEYPEMKINKDDFSIRVAKTPAEACYCYTIITIPKSEERMTPEDVRYLAKQYDKLLNLAKNDPTLLEPSYIDEIKSWNQLRQLLLDEQKLLNV